jgi:threonine aldolase
VLVYESGGAAAHSGLVMRGVAAEAGWLTPSHLQEWAGLCDGVLQPPSIVVLEQTHRSAGGRVWPLDLFRRTVAAARELGVGVHLDGARLLNAAVASGVPAATWGGLADTVTVCFSKGLGCPLGAVIATSAERIEEAWRCKFQFGGALRQAGVVAAAMLYALDHHVERLADDHRRARRLAEGLAVAGLLVDPDATETNFVAIDVRPLGLGTTEAVTRIEEEGVLVSTLRPGVLRAVTYLGVDDEAIETAIDAIPQALGARVGA